MKQIVFFVVAILTGTSAMADSARDLQKFETGTYMEISSRPNPSMLSYFHIPSLASLLLAAERRHGRHITEAEVVSIRDNALVVVVPDRGELLEQDRGYKDIDPRNCWLEWQALRTQFNE